MAHVHLLKHRKFLTDSKGFDAVIGSLFFILATSLGAYVRIPVPGSPVPITLQTFFVLLAGAILGGRLGAASQVGYVLMGAIGIPVFQGAGFGMSYLLGPTGGYIIGFIAAAYAVGYIARSGRPGIMRSILAFSAGTFIIYAIGAAWLAYICRLHPIGAVSAGVLPFVIGDIAKLLLAAVLYSGISNRTDTIFPA